MTASMKNDRAMIRAWSLYDFANSAYTTTTLAVLLPAIFASEIVPEEGFEVFGTTLDAESLFGYSVGAAAVVAFLFSPVLGAVGDFAAAKLRFLKLFGYGGALLSILFALTGPGDVWPTIILFLAVEACWAFAQVFYDSFLPHLSTDDSIDRISSRGFAWGYLGGGTQYLLSLLLIQLSPDSFTATATRIGIAGAGVWWFVFAYLSFRRLREPAPPEPLPARYQRYRAAVTYAGVGFARTWHTALQLRRFPQLLLFLTAFLLYNDGVQTVISISAVFATETLDLEVADVAIAFFVVQVIGLVGALAFGWLAGRIGTKTTILGSLVLWTSTSVWAFFIPAEQPTAFLALAATVGFVLGGTQALSRSLYGSMIPEQASAEFYGFYSVFSKFASIWGPLLFAWINQVTGSSRRAVLSLIVLFAAGFVMLARVDVGEARRARHEWRFHGVEVEAG